MILSQKISMQFFYVLTGLIVSIVAAGSDTIHYTNSPSYLETGANYTAYKLNVPGTNGITIIETVNDDRDTDDPDPEDDYPTQGPTQGSKKMVYAPDLLHKFIEEYNAKPKNTRHRYNQDEDEDSEMEVNPSQNRRVTRVKVLHRRKQQQTDQNRYETDKKGWVTLEAVPWSRSKVSKWKPNRNKDNSATVSSVNLYNVRPIGSLENTQLYYSSDNENTKYNPHPSKRPSLFTDTYKNDDFYDRKDQHTTTRPDRHRPRPFKRKDPSYYSTPEPELEIDSSFDRWYDYGFRPNPGSDHRHTSNKYQQTSETPKPPRKNFLPNHNGYSHRNEIHNKGSYTFNNYDSPYEEDEEKSYLYQERPETVPPSTYPSHGNGEWVLVSSTKGYQYPTRRQRGITFNASPNSSNYSVRTHKSIKLTVLPAKVTLSNETPMTTSHDGLIEVESSQQTVEDSVQKQIEKKTKRKTQSSGALQGIAVENDAKADSTAILAAVGAGMVPATVAMLMPMLGRKKREILQPVQNHSIYPLEMNIRE